MTTDDLNPLAKVCKDMIQQSRGILAWAWDDRFECAIATYPAAKEADVEAIFQRVFQHEWDCDSISTAPENLAIASDDLGGLRPGQFIHATDPEREAFLMAVFWPWANGTTVSIRVLLVGAANAARLLKGWLSAR